MQIYEKKAIFAYKINIRTMTLPKDFELYTRNLMVKSYTRLSTKDFPKRLLQASA